MQQQRAVGRRIRRILLGLQPCQRGRDRGWVLLWCCILRWTGRARHVLLGSSRLALSFQQSSTRSQNTDRENRSRVGQGALRAGFVRSAATDIGLHRARRPRENGKRGRWASAARQKKRRRFSGWREALGGREAASGFGVKPRENDEGRGGAAAPRSGAESPAGLGAGGTSSASRPAWSYTREGASRLAAPGCRVWC